MLSRLFRFGRASARVGLTAAGRQLASPAALKLFRRPPDIVDSCSVHMLVSSRTWHAGLLAAASLEHHSQKRWRIFIHDDGSVSGGAAGVIERTLPGARFVSRAEADRRVAQYLGHHPLCLDHRGRHNLFLKFFDAPAFSDRPRFVVLDSDVIFFRRPSALIEWADSGSERVLYNEDTREKFCIPRPEIEAALGVKMLPRFNSGLVLIPQSAIDLSLADRLLSAFEATAHAPQFFEQTLYALMASASASGGEPLPRTYNITWGLWREPGSICRHYVGDFKHDLLYIEGAPHLLGSLLASSLRGGK